MNHIQRFIGLFGLAIFFSLYSCTIQSNSIPDSSAPNIVLIMGDDIGYSDLGCYGSEIETPNLDMLADNGLKFRTFYNMAKCNPTRSSLMTGLYKGNQRAINFASLLKDAGYFTVHTGKEHFDKWVPKHCYSAEFFDHAFTFWATTEYFVPPDSNFSRPFYLDGREIHARELEAVQKPFYKTDAFTDYAFKYLDAEKARGGERPFFLFLPYHAAHYPLQARPEDIEKYRGKYKVGWDSIRQHRYEKMLALGIINSTYRLSEPTDNINKYRGHPKGDEERRALIPLYRPWEELNEKEKDELDLEMAVFAAIVDRMDQNIGRLVQWLKDNGEYENTVIMFLSDNGSCPFDSNRDFEIPPGPANSYRTLSAAWANVGNTPFKYFKQFGHEGGARTHFIMHWPEKIKEGSLITQPGHLVDLFPTFLDIAGLDYPTETEHGSTIPLHGKSLMPIIKGEQRAEPEYFISGLAEKFRMFRSGDYKIVRANEGPWELYDMEKDPTEIDNLAETEPEKLQGLVGKYDEVKAEMDALSKED